jgi:hypothetical protein
MFVLWQSCWAGAHIIAGWQDMNDSMGEAIASGIAHNISSTEEKVDILKSE